MPAPGDLTRQLERLRSQRPHLRTVLPGLESLLEAAAATQAALESELPELPARLVHRDPDLPLLDEETVQSLSPWLVESARRMAPAVAAVFEMPNVASWVTAEEAEPRLTEATLALLRFDGQALLDMARTAELPVELFALALRECIAPVFTALGARLAAQRAEELRGKGWCPVCGQNPCLATLGTAAFDTSFLATSGGQRLFTCSLCDTSWRVSKGLCPACGVEHGSEQHPEGKQILHVENLRHERLEWCDACRSYIPCLDLREIEAPLPTPLALLTLMHLDVAALEEQLTPVTTTLSNTLVRSLADTPTAERCAHEALP